MDVSTGLSALSTAVGLTRALRDAIKGGQIKGDEIAGRVGEIYDYIVDSKDALLDAKDQIQTAKEEMIVLAAELERHKIYVLRHSVHWKRLPDETDEGPFCPICFAHGTMMPLAAIGKAADDPGTIIFRCPTNHVPPGQGRQFSYRISKDLVKPDRYVVPE
jgi:hypothetical protein